MIIECVRMASAWLEDATHGFNAQLAALTLDGSDTVPADVSVANEVDDDEVAAGQLPETLPACVVSVERATAISDQVATETGDGECVLSIQVGTADDSPAAAKRAGSYYLRALALCLRQWERQDPNGPARRRNNVSILEIQQIEVNAMYERVGDKTITAGARVPLVYRDTAAPA